MKLICFDLDNTLVDSDNIHVLAFNKAFKKNSLPSVKASKLVKLFGPVEEIVVKSAFPSLPKHDVTKIAKDHNLFLIKEKKKHVKPFPGVKKVLNKLKEDYKICVVSNCSHKEIISIIKAAGLDSKIFGIIIGNDDVSQGKPYPDEILKAEKLMHHKVDYMIGDSPYDIIAGKRAGCETIAVLTGHFSRKRLKEENPDHIIKDLKELPKVLKNG